MQIRAAFAAADYTPEPGIPFGRLGVNRLVPTGVHSQLMARLALFTDGNTLAGILTLDQNRVRPLVCRELRQVLADATGGVSGDFTISATHAHNAPILVPWRPDDPPYTMLDRLRDIVAGLAREAMDAFQAVTLRMGEASVPGVAACRRPVYRADDGREQVGTHGPREGDDFMRMESPDEDALRVLFALDDTDQVCGGIVNFPCHPVTMYPEPLTSADYPGAVCSRLEERFGHRFLFLTGPAGDQSPRLGRGPEGCDAVADGIAKAAIETRTAPVPGTSRSIHTARREVRLPRRELGPDQVACAQAHIEAVTRGERPPPLAPRLYGYAWHFRANSPAVDDWLAREIVGLWEVQRRGEVRRQEEALEVQLLSIGPLRILAMPGEPFSAFGRTLRKLTPWLLVAEQSNGHAGYLPQVDDFARGGYECCLAQQSRLVPEAGQRLTDAAADLVAEADANPRPV